MRVAVLQSNYIPWKGYFDIVHDVDTFIFLEDVQYTKSDWRNRNRIKTRTGSQWLSVPVTGSRSMKISEVAFSDDLWANGHWRSLSYTYGRCEHFQRYRRRLEELYLGQRWQKLSEMNRAFIEVISREFLHIETSFLTSSEFGASGAKLDRLLDLLVRAGATSYVSGPAARAYIDESRFAEKGIELIWKDYSGYPKYPQLSEPFEHGVTILDLLFHVGPNAPNYIWGWRDSPAS